MRIAQSRFELIKMYRETVRQHFYNDAQVREKLAECVKHYEEMAERGLQRQIRSVTLDLGRGCKQSATIRLNQDRRLLSIAREMLANFDLHGRLGFRKMYFGY